MNWAVAKETHRAVSEDVVNPRRTAAIGISTSVLIDEIVLIAKVRFSLGCHPKESNIFLVTTPITPAIGNYKAIILKALRKIRRLDSFEYSQRLLQNNNLLPKKALQSTMPYQRYDLHFLSNA